MIFLIDVGHFKINSGKESHIHLTITHEWIHMYSLSVLCFSDDINNKNMSQNNNYVYLKVDDVACIKTLMKTT